MHNPEKNLSSLVERYFNALEGGQVIDALRFHATKARLNMRFISWDGAEITVIGRVFTAALAQKKLDELLQVIKEDGFDIFEEQTVLKPNQSQIPQGEFDERKYKEKVIHETEYVDIRGIGRRRAEEAIVFPILDLYTELYVQVGLSNLDLDRGRMRGIQRIALTEMVRLTRCLLVMGDPGSGKTTFLRFLARKKIDENLSAELPVYLRLADIYDHAKAKGIPLDSRAIADFFIQNCKKNNINISEDEFNSMALAGRWLWLLDSLDELSSDADREEVVKAVEDASNKWGNCKFVMTSRPIPLKAKSIPIGFEKVGIDSWSKEDIKLFLEAWTKLLMPDAADDIRTRHWGNLLATIINRPDLRTLAKNAVMVTAMAVVHHNETKLPEGRADLLVALIYWLIHARTRPGGIPNNEFSFIENCYKELALSMFEAEGGRRRRVGRLWAANKIKHHFNDDVDGTLAFITREETDTGVLVRRGEGDLEFWHLSFQEYLAAEEIAGKTDDIEKGWWAKIKENLDATEWREVIIFVPLCLRRLGSERVDLFFERLADSCINSDIQTKARRVALGGIILRDLSLMGYKPDHVQKWTQILNDITMLFGKEGENVPLETRYDALVAYGLGGDIRLRNFEETWIKVLKGSFCIGAQSKDSQKRNYDPFSAPWERPVKSIKLAGYEIRKYPITVEEYKDFVDDDCYRNKSYWTTDGWDWVQETGCLAPLDWEEQLISPNTPVTGISWYEASAYCEWLTESDIRDVEYRLPSEAEWEYAAKRNQESGHMFPWGNKVTPGDKCEANFAWSGLRKKSPVGMFYKCSTKDGIIDLFGNVEEWCRDSWAEDHSSCPVDGRPVINDSVDCIVKGGSTIRFARLCRPTYRSCINKRKRYHTVGFRPVRYWTTPTGVKSEILNVVVDEQNSQEKKFVFSESLDYFKVGNDSIWGSGEPETINAVNLHVTSGTWLDLGAGDGRYSVRMLNKADRLIAADVDSHALQKLWFRSPKLQRNRLSLLVLNVMQLPFSPNSFDGVLCTGILHLFPEDILFDILSQISRIIKPKGILIIDMGTDIERLRADGSIFVRPDDQRYTTKQALNILETALSNYSRQVQISSFQDDLTSTGEYDFTTKGNFILLAGRKLH